MASGPLTSESRRTRAAVLAVLGAAGFTVSSYLASYQLGVTSSVWDPLFGTGSERVLTSAVSRLLPVPDATLGAAVYAVDVLLAIAILVRPEAPVWLPAALAALSVAGAIVALILVVLQPLVGGSLCSLCLVSAGVSVALATGATTELRDRLDSRATGLPAD